ncbi:helicase domain-containing protein [Brevibacillus borstelensis AK1]|uniref:Helicase domain-containing protein n=1 Tax=Brevibacillus borstelensis AK1 TaxID=1300222 RepID=M8DEB9_9BACL|nr:DEAD/DEAH box helicase [Brevibacillus borstelensis]EMT54684.1 helicase domain-containing protein [Brevibacillus borstelensis AK1]
MLRIRYIPNTHMASLSMEEPSPAWAEIRRLCLENAKDVHVESGVSLIIPWWAFLSFKNALRLVLKKHNLALDIDEETHKLLQDSNQKKSSYLGAAVGNSVSEEDLQEKLRKVGFKRILTKQQLRNVSKLLSLPAGATFSVPGAGKTTEALALYFAKRKQNTKLLIVAPKNAFAAWEEQLGICYPQAPSIVRLRGGLHAVEALLSQSPEIMLITYQQLPNVIDPLAVYISSGSTFMFLDESHRIKRGNDGVIGKSILKISHIPELKLIMSGTPMPNSTLDLVPQFNFLFPEIRVDANSVIDLIRPVYVRTTKNELGLKNPRYVYKPVQLSIVQRRLYELMRSEEARQAENLHSADRNRLRAMGRSAIKMLQLVSNPALLARIDSVNNDLLREIIAEGDSPKIAYVCNRVRQLAEQGRKTIVWSQFVENVEQLSFRLRDLGAEYIHGGVEAGSEDDLDTREAKIKRFHDDPNCYVLIANPAAAGEGISLHTVCHDAIYLDRSYNAAHFLQSVDRIHRLGLPSDIETNVEIVYCPNTVDESVNKRLQLKINKMAEVLNDRSLNIEPEYDDEELQSDGISSEDIHDYVRHLRGH